MSKPDDSLFDDLPEPNSRKNQMPGDDENPFADDLPDEIPEDQPFNPFDFMVDQDSSDENDGAENTIPSTKVFPNLNLNLKDDVSDETIASLIQETSDDEFASLLAEDSDPLETTDVSDVLEIQEDMVLELPEPEIENPEIEMVSDPILEDLSFPELNLEADSNQDSDLDMGLDFDSESEMNLPEMSLSDDLVGDSDQEALTDFKPLEAGMAEVTIVTEEPDGKKGKKGKKEKKKKFKAVKEKKPKVPRQPREGEMNSVAFVVALVFLVIFALVNLYAIFSYGLSALLFLIFFDLFAAGVIAVPVFLGRSKEKITTYDIALAVSLVAILLSCMLLLTRLAEYGGQVNTKNFSINNHVVNHATNLRV